MPIYNVQDVYTPMDFYTKASAHSLERQVNHRLNLVPRWFVQKPRGFAFIEFVDKRDAEDAKAELDGVALDGR